MRANDDWHTPWSILCTKDEFVKVPINRHSLMVATYTRSIVAFKLHRLRGMGA